MYCLILTSIDEVDIIIFPIFQRSNKGTERLHKLIGSIVIVSGETKKSSIDISLFPVLVCAFSEDKNFALFI